MSQPHRIVIVGGGFAGMNAALKLGGKPFDVTLVDRRNFHLFQPLLYQVASGGLSFAKLGATDFGYRLAEQFGLKLVPPRPGLVPG